MSDTLVAAATALLATLGCAFCLLAGLGVVRMPDMYMRMQAATKAGTLGVGCLVLAVAIWFRSASVAAEAFLVIFFVFLTAPVASHLIARSARRSGQRAWAGDHDQQDQQAPTHH